MVRRLLGAALLSLAAVVQAQPAGFLPPTLFEPPLPTRAEPGPRGFAGDVAYLPDVTYKRVTGFRPLALDLYVPPPAAQPHPLVLWIHGGGNEIGNPRADWTWGDWRPVLARLAARGFVVAAVSYRLSAEAPFPAAIDDVQDALRFLKTNAARWGADPQRSVAWGLSAGGALAALLGTRCPGGTEPGLAPGQASACVQGVVDWFGPAAFEPLQQMPPMRRYLACTDAGCDPATLRAAGALHQVRPGLPPYLIVHGEADPLVTVDHGRRLADALRAAGNPVQLVVHPGLGHGFDGATPAQLEAILQHSFEAIGRLAGRAAADR